MRILFVAETGSIHTARWINQLENTGWDIHVFQATVPSYVDRNAPRYSVCEELRCGELHLPHPHDPLTRTSRKLARKARSFLGTMSSKCAPDALGWSEKAQSRRGESLRNLIQALRPTVIHSLGLNVNWRNLCLPVIQARLTSVMASTTPWIYSSWGTDLSYYAAQSPEHHAAVESVLRTCNYYIAECKRDARLAEELGFRGEFAGFFPAFGGVRSTELSPLRQQGASSSRKTILLKGRDNSDVGGIYRAMTAMKAFRLCGDVLRDYQICIALASPAVAAAAAALSSQMDLRVRVLPQVPYVDVLRIMGASRLFLSLTANDGLPGMLVEAMSLGSLPIHSDLESIREWVKNGETALLVPYDDPTAVAAALERAVTDDALVDWAAELNARLIQEQLSDAVVRPRVIGMYEHVAEAGPITRNAACGSHDCV